ncbi:MAG: hypothetical protein A2V99_10310 [Spirochaetes bacterium RBG_16_67_19]|nr:MAG: hypothetical protein A2V99_10310 [Spirochaetes bacterium RBG_16_67_19]
MHMAVKAFAANMSPVLTIPPVLQIGSTSTAATVSGFSLTMISSNSRAQKRSGSKGPRGWGRWVAAK